MEVILINKEDEWSIYMKWCNENRCYNKKCAYNKYGICEDIRVIKNCKSYKNEVPQ